MGLNASRPQTEILSGSSGVIKVCVAPLNTEATGDSDYSSQPHLSVATYPGADLYSPSVSLSLSRCLSRPRKKADRETSAIQLLCSQPGVIGDWFN